MCATPLSQDGFSLMSTVNELTVTNDSMQKSHRGYPQSWISAEPDLLLLKDGLRHVLSHHT